MRSQAQAYALSVAAVAAAVLVRKLLDPVLGDALPLVTLYGAVAASVWLGGYLPAVLTSILGYLSCAYLFIPPRGRLTFDGSATIVGFVAYLFTCTVVILFGEATRRAQRRAQLHGELQRVTLRSIGDAVIATDLEGRVTYLNEVAQALTGWSEREATGRPLSAVFRIINEQSREVVESPTGRALREGAVVGLANHTILIRRDGTECPIDDSAAPIRDEAGTISGCVLTFRDVTTQRRTELDRTQQLASARLLAAIVESSDDGIVSKSLDGTIQSWNAGAERIFGYPADQAIGRHISLVIPPDRIAEEEQIIRSLKAGERIDHFETIRVTADGRRIPVSLTISPVKDEAGEVIGASKIIRDITDRRQAEAEREKFVTLVESSTDFIGMCDLGGIPFFINRAGLEMVGLDSVDEARRTPVREFFFPEDQHRVMEEFFPAVMREGHGEIEVRFRHFKTGEARWMAYKVLVLIDSDAVPVAYATVSQDVTERRRMEDHLRQLATGLADADRRKDEFLATLAHELRNPLAPLTNMLEVLKRTRGSDEPFQQASDAMERQLGQLVRLVDDLLDLNRITRNRLELRQSRIALAPVIEQAIEASRPLIDQAGHELQVTMPAEPIYLDADPARLAQVFGNLLNNSCKYTKAGGRIALAVTLQGSDVLVSIKDTGVGIPPDKLGLIFDMFMQVDRSLDRTRDGLGIGLTLVKRLVAMHGGTTEARSAGLGKGSEFIVRLPVAVGAPAPALVRDEAPYATVKRRILVVDDNKDSALTLAMLLRLDGHETLTAHDGPGALDAIRKHRPEVVFLDIGLPRLNGHEVCRAVRAEPWGRDMIVIALTGWGHEDDRRKSEEAGFNGHLIKPVDHHVLTDLLNSLPSAPAQAL